MYFRFKIINPKSGKVIRAKISHDREAPGNLFLHGQGFAFSMTPHQSIALANRIADLLETPGP